MQKASIWSNPDGLVVGFGPRKAESSVGAKVSLGGKRQQVTLDIVGTEMPLTTDVTRQLPNAVFIPAGAYIESAILVVQTPFSGGTGLQVGTWNGLTDVVVANNNIIPATLTAALVADAEIVGAGLIGTVAAVNHKVIATATTNLFTAGKAIVVIEYIL